MSVDRLIYDALVSHRSVSMPQTGGTLEVKRRGAKRISDTQLVPPRNVVTFTRDEPEGAVSAISLIATDGGTGEEEAAARYASWLAEARREDGTIVIDGVGRLNGNGFATADRLGAALNPEGEEPVYIENESRSGGLWGWLLTGILLALLLGGGIWAWKQGYFGPDRSKDHVVETVVTDRPAGSDPAVGHGSDTTAGNTSTSTADAEKTPTTSGSGQRFHVIAGAFAIESNADNFIARLKREHPELTPEKITDPANGYNMVSILQAPTRREANQKMNLWWDIDFDLWIFEQK